MELIIPAREKDLGGFSVRRVLPYAKHRMVGPFIFLDHMGPANFKPGQGIDVRPHPHIGLATVTYLFEGEIVHRDNLGSHQTVRPGEVNWMTAGRGIVHSERTDPALRATGYKAHGLQIWVALPKESEQVEPEFFHYSAEEMPIFYKPGVRLKLIAGEAYGHKSPVRIYSPLFYLEVFMKNGSTLDLPNEYSERGVYVVSGLVTTEKKSIHEAEMDVFDKGTDVTITAGIDTHLVIIGGEPFPEERHIFWNFVSSSPALIEEAKEKWRKQEYVRIEGETDFIPLPE